VWPPVRVRVAIGSAIAMSWFATATVTAAAEDPVLRIARVGDSGVVRLSYGNFRGEAEFDSSEPTELRATNATVELKDGARLFGMREFTIRPASEALVEAPVFERLRQVGVLAPRQLAVRVAVGDGTPVEYIVEEGFSKELVESQQRREGVLFRFDPSVLPELRVVPSHAKKVRKSKARRAELGTAEGLLAGFFHGDLALADAFDLDSMAAFFAVAEVTGAEAMLALPNLRFYFNPVIQRIEPVGYRGVPAHDPAVDSALDPALDSALDSALDGWITPSAPWPARLLEDPELSARFDQQLRNVAHAIVRAGTADAKATTRARAFETSTLPPFVPIEPALFVRAEASGLRANPIPQAALAEALARHPFLEWVEARHVLAARAGSWTVAGSLVLPEGVGLELNAGTTLLFEPEAMLLATGPLRFSGSEPAPVELGPADGTSWQGIVALRSAEPHRWQHVVVRKTTGIRQGSWNLTGGVTFRASEVEISNSRIDTSSAEDALNLIRSRFTFTGLSITRAASDAFDCDFCRGTMRGGRIERVGGDGIDVSGSEITVVGVELAAIGDKALSVGEVSRMTARELTIDGVGTAAASKDGSELRIEASKISAVEQIALMAYTKKAEYGPARLDARSLSLQGVEHPAVAQTGSQLSIDGKPRQTEALDVDRLYREGPMKKGPKTSKQKKKANGKGPPPQ